MSAESNRGSKVTRRQAVGAGLAGAGALSLPPFLEAGTAWGASGAGGEMANRLHFLGLAQLLLEHAAGGAISRQAQHALRPPRGVAKDHPG